MEDCKNRKCSLCCDYISVETDQYYGDIICFCNYGHRMYVGFIEDVDHGCEECLFPDHPPSDYELSEKLKIAWEQFIDEIKGTQLFERFISLVDWISEKVFK